MNKQEILEEYKNQEERLLIAKILDKLDFIKTKNKIDHEKRKRTEYDRRSHRGFPPGKNRHRRR